MIITFDDDESLPTIDVVNEPGRVIVDTPGTLYREWGRISGEGGEVKYPKTANAQYDLGSINIRAQDSESVRWRVQFKPNQPVLEFYFTELGIVCSVTTKNIHTVAFQVLCAESAFSGYVEPGPEGEGSPRFERVG